jgi:hypothetical protein
MSLLGTSLNLSQIFVAIEHVFFSGVDSRPQIYQRHRKNFALSLMRHWAKGDRY